MLKVNDQISIPLREFQFRYVRSSGPGGQNVNKVNSKVQLRWDLTKSAALSPAVLERFQTRYHRLITGEGELVLSSQRFRDQGRNVADVLAKLAEMVRSVAKAPKKRKPTRVSRSQKERRLDAKRRQAEKKHRRQGFD